jgi:hypothetical protein
MPRVIECKASRDYRFRLKFDDGKAATVVGDDGVELDPDILYRDLLLSKAAKEFNSPGLAPMIE